MVNDDMMNDRERDRAATKVPIWSGADIIELELLWNAGHTAREIAKNLGKSRNAVIGKAHRLDLAPRPSPIQRKRRLR